MFAQIAPNLQDQIITELQKAGTFGSGVILAFAGGFLAISLIAWVLDKS